MQFSGCSVGAQGHFAGFIMRTALGTALLTVASFGVWHNKWVLSGFYNFLFESFETFQTFPDGIFRVGGGGGSLSV